jgi:hypothetical protein
MQETRTGDRAGREAQRGKERAAARTLKRITPATGCRIAMQRNGNGSSQRHREAAANPGRGGAPHGRRVERTTRDARPVRTGTRPASRKIALFDAVMPRAKVFV